MSAAPTSAALPEAPPAPRKSRRKGWWVALATLALLELGYRTYLGCFADFEEYAAFMPFTEVPARYHMYRGHPYLNYCLTENFASRDGLNRHNARGYRGPEVADAAAPDTYRILLLGGSTAYDTSIADWHQSWAAQLERVLVDERGQRVEVVNAGCGGWTSYESVLDLALRGLELAPDLVVAYFGVNDVHARLVPPELYRADNSGYAIQWHPEVSAWEHLVILRWIGTRLHFARTNSVGELAQRRPLKGPAQAAALAANPPIYLERNCEYVLDLCQPRGADVLLATFAWSPLKGDYVSGEAYQQGLRETNASIRAVAERRGAPLYDFAAEMPVELTYWADGRHNNAAGARLKAERFADAILARFGPVLRPHAHPARAASRPGALLPSSGAGDAR